MCVAVSMFITGVTLCRRCASAVGFEVPAESVRRHGPGVPRRPAGRHEARITGYARSDLGGPRLSFDDIPGRMVLSAPAGYVVASLGGVLFTFEPNCACRFVPQGKVDAMRATAPPRERPASPPEPRRRGR